MARLTIVGVFYSGYKDLWVDFIRLLKRNWKDCSYSFVIISDTEDEINFEGEKLISLGAESEYSRKIQEAVKVIESDYYLLLLEDFFIGDKVDSKKIESILSFIVDNKIKYYSMPMKEFANNYKGKKIDKQRRKLSPKAKYTLSCQPAIWERNFLEKCIGEENYNAWVFEGIYTKSKKAHNEAFLEGCVVDLSNPLNIKHGALQGKMVPTTVDYFSGCGYCFNTKRKIYSRKKYFKEKIIIFCRGLMPYWMQKTVKKIIPMKSIVTKYNDDISLVMERMNLE